jgi:hypothetical protein
MHVSRTVFTLAFASAGVSAICARALPAQAASSSVVVRIHVVDSSGTPVAGADVSLMRGLSRVGAPGQTDARGDRTLTVLRSGGDDEIVVRKIGFQRVSRFFPDSAPSPAFTIVLARSVRALDTVRVAAAEDVRRKSYFIDADAIEHSPRLVIDALDVVTKLRPDMIWGRSGLPDGIDQHVTRTRISVGGKAYPGGAAAIRSPGQVVANGAKSGYCPPVQNIWVNGERIHDVAAYNAVASLRRTGRGVYISGQLATILASIKPEHIAEMEYHPCTDAAEAPLATNAIMVQLKDGIGFDPGHGSYVVTPAARAGSSLLVAASPFPRILGVFDDVSGDPLADADVLDVSTGTAARTTSTGTVILSFLPSGLAELRIQRPGFAPLEVPVSMSPRDTTPVTIVLSRAKAP